jgi:ubiquinone/menaquinone biosynthesis C-methylase UbiE
MKSRKLVKEYYKKIAPFHDKIFHGETEGEFYEMDQYLLNLIRDWCPEYSTHILEVGCGTGYWLEYFLAMRNARIVGVDISPEMLAIAENKFSHSPKIELYQGDIITMDFLEDNIFDFILCAWIFQYLVNVNDFRKGLQELKRVSNPEGIILLAEDSPPTKAPYTDTLVKKDELGGLYYYQDKYEGMSLPVYRRLLEADEMKNVLKDEGFTILMYEQKISMKVYVVGIKD